MRRAWQFCAWLLKNSEFSFGDRPKRHGWKVPIATQSHFVTISFCRRIDQHLTNKEDCLDSNELARRIVEIVEDKQAEDILLLNVSEQTTIATYFVIATVDNERQANAVRDDLWEQLRVQENIRPMNSSGAIGQSGGWILLDYGDVILHLFSKEAREYYKLEELWQEASVVMKMF